MKPKITLLYQMSFYLEHFEKTLKEANLSTIYSDDLAISIHFVIVPFSRNMENDIVCGLVVNFAIQGQTTLKKKRKINWGIFLPIISNSNLK